MSLLKDKPFLHSSLVLSDLCCFFVVEYQRGPDNRGATSGSPPKLHCTKEGAPSIQIPHRWHHPGQYCSLESKIYNTTTIKITITTRMKYVCLWICLSPSESNA